MMGGKDRKRKLCSMRETIIKTREDCVGAGVKNKKAGFRKYEEPRDYDTFLHDLQQGTALRILVCRKPNPVSKEMAGLNEGETASGGCGEVQRDLSLNMEHQAA